MIVQKLIRSKRRRFPHHAIPLSEEDTMRRLLASKVMEEAAELARAILADDKDAVIDEMADVREVMRLAHVPFGLVGDDEVRDAANKKTAEAGALTFKYIEREERDGYRVVDLGNGIIFEVKENGNG